MSTGPIYGIYWYLAVMPQIVPKFKTVNLEQMQFYQV